MFLNDIADALTAKQIREVARKQRLDPKCWTGYHKAGTKVKGDTRVNNCVKNESDPKFGKQVLGHTKGDDEHHAVYKHPAPRKFDHYGPPHDVFINGKKWKTFPTYTEAAFVAMSLNKKGKDAHIQPALDQSSLKEFAPSPEYGGGDDGFSEETLKQLAAEWWHGDADPEVERTLNAAGWTIGQDEGNYENGGVFVVQQGDINGDSYLSWPAEELEGLAEGSSQSRLQPGTQVMLWLGPRNMLPNPPRDDKRYWDRGVVVDEPEMMTGSWQVLVKSERKGQSPISPQRVFVLKQQGVAEVTGDKPFDRMMTTIKTGTKKQATADRREQKRQDQERTRAAIDNMFGGSMNHFKNLKIKEEGVEESFAELGDTKNRKYQIPTHRTIVDLVDGHNNVLPAGSTLRQVTGSNRLYVHLVNGRPKEIYNLSFDDIERITDDMDEDSWHGTGDAWHGTGDAWSGGGTAGGGGAGAAVMEYADAHMIPNDSSSAIPGTPGLNEFNAADPAQGPGVDDAQSPIQGKKRLQLNKISAPKPMTNTQKPMGIAERQEQRAIAVRLAEMKRAGYFD